MCWSCSSGRAVCVRLGLRCICVLLLRRDWLLSRHSFTFGLLAANWSHMASQVTLGHLAVAPDARCRPHSAVRFQLRRKQPRLATRLRLPCLKCLKQWASKSALAGSNRPPLAAVNRQFMTVNSLWCSIYEYGVQCYANVCLCRQWTFRWATAVKCVNVSVRNRNATVACFTLIIVHQSCAARESDDCVSKRT